VIKTYMKIEHVPRIQGIVTIRIDNLSLTVSLT